MNLIKAQPGFLEGLRALCDEYGTILIFDEVMTGFRAGPKGVYGISGVTPDLCTLGKVIGGGMPVGAFGGRADIMEHIAPLGTVYQAGTLSGNPVSVAAGLKTLEIISREGFYENLNAQLQKMLDGFTDAAKAGVSFCADSAGGMFGIYFTENIPTNFAEVSKSNLDAFNQFFHHMLDNGVHLAPSAFEAGFISAAHNDDVIEETIKAARASFEKIKL